MLRRWSILLAMLAMTVGTVLSAGTASAATGGLPGLGGFLGGGAWPPPGTGRWIPGGPINRGGLTYTRAQGQVESTNWSGYAATSGTYNAVSATWTQPTGKCTSGDQYAAFWVGLDGYSSSTVEQTGTEVDCDGRTAQYYAWWEMYPGASEELTSDPVHAGDVFNASVTYNPTAIAPSTPANSFTLVLTDTTAKWTATEIESPTGTVARSSAEVIAEAPCCTFLGGILPLTDFGTVDFSNSMVTPSTTGTAEDIGGAAGLEAITMVDEFGRDKDTVSALSPTGADGTAFDCVWKASS
jgi:hypothetical protein